MKRFLLSALSGFLATFLAGSVLAMAVLQPLVAKDFGIYVRSMEQGLNMPAMVSGYLLLGLALALLYPRVDWDMSWAKKGASLGFVLGLAVFFAGHLVVAGWSTLPAGPMIFSGFVDAFSLAAGGMAVALLNRGS
jgi:hypothetical protein